LIIIYKSSHASGSSFFVYKEGKGIMAGRISIPIEFEVARESAASVIKTLESQLAKLKPGTAIYDSIKK
jgi:hypothetical protein